VWGKQNKVVTKAKLGSVARKKGRTAAGLVNTR